MGKLTPRYPIYVPSKGRAGAPMTIRMFARASVDFRVVVEPQEVSEYERVAPGKVLALPESGRGLVFSRNWIFNHAVSVAAAHAEVLARGEVVPLFRAVTDPPSRGTPYRERSVRLPVACSMGFWHEVGDYCAVRALALGHQPMRFNREPVYAQYFPLCGMNIAFRPGDWHPWWRFVEGAARWDDIWQGWLWQREAYRRRHCFSLHGPDVRHARQSNVWRNLADEAPYLEASETLWREIATATTDDYESLVAMLPHRRSLPRQRP